MFGFFKKQPKEIRDLLERIDVAKQKFPEDVAYLLNPFLDLLKKTIKSDWKQEHIKNYIEQIRAGETHEGFIYNAIVHSTADKLESGQHHIYRGVLGPEGHKYKLIFEHAINTIIDSGAYTKEWADENLRAAVYKGIKDIG